MAGFGTGLGIVWIVDCLNKAKARVYATEGGHISIAPATTRDW